MVKDEAVEMLKDYKFVDDSEYCQSWDDPRKTVVETGQTTTTTYSSFGQAMSGVSQSFSKMATDFGSSVGNTMADAASTLSGLLDINPSQTEEQQPTLPKKKLKKQKKRGWGQGK